MTISIVFINTSKQFFSSYSNRNYSVSAEKSKLVLVVTINAATTAQTQNAVVFSLYIYIVVGALITAVNE
jgi:hypothetical protein